MRTRGVWGAAAVAGMLLLGVLFVAPLSANGPDRADDLLRGVTEASRGAFAPASRPSRREASTEPAIAEEAIAEGAPSESLASELVAGPADVAIEDGAAEDRANEGRPAEDRAAEDRANEDRANEDRAIDVSEDVSQLHVDLEARVPERWLSNNTDGYQLRPARRRRRLPRRCRTQGGYRDHCSGPRKVASPSAVAAERAERLGLGHPFVARLLMHQPPLEEWLTTVSALQPDPETRLTFPVPDGRMGRGFGQTRRGSLRHRRHNGVDIGASEGSEIVAARGGMVVYAGNDVTGYGNLLIVLHEDGYTTLYAHCQQILTAPGELVERGQPVARVGQTGFAYAAHLHFEWRQRGWARNPGRRFIPRDEVGSRDAS